MTAPTSSLLHAHGLCIRRGGRLVVQDVDLQVAAGCWLAVVGPNGAGKSSLLRCLAGVMAPCAGGILGPSREHIGWLGQNPGGDEAMAVEDVVALGRLSHQGWLAWPRVTQADRDAVDQALQDTDMAWARHRPLGHLSGGERQRVHLARALAAQAPLLLLDEPVAHLDAPHQRLVAQVLRREAARGRAVVSVLHELPLALQADRLAVMGQGRLQAEGPCDDPALHRAMEAVFEHAIQVVRLDHRWIVVPCP